MEKEYKKYTKFVKGKKIIATKDIDKFHKKNPEIPITSEMIPFEKEPKTLSEELVSIWNTTPITAEALILSTRTELADRINEKVRESIRRLKEKWADADAHATIDEIFGEELTGKEGEN